jgi:hypothetical protein
MYESYSEARDRGATLAAEVSESVRRTIEHRARDRAFAGGSGGSGLLDVLGEDELRSARPPCGGFCERFGAQGCHSPRCRVGGE